MTIRLLPVLRDFSCCSLNLKIVCVSRPSEHLCGWQCLHVSYTEPVFSRPTLLTYLTTYPDCYTVFLWFILAPSLRSPRPSSSSSSTSIFLHSSTN